jgi:NitT/TauT family transport system substrate-binding protein
MAFHPKKSAIAVATTVFALSGIVGGAYAQSDLPEIKVALATADNNFNPTTGSIFKLAEQLGFYEKHGVKVTFVVLDGTPNAVAALNSGDVDAADIAIDAAIRLRADNDVAIRGFAATAMGNPFLIASKDDIKTVEELAGRSYAIADNGSLDHNLTQAVLGTYDVAGDAPNFVAIGAPDIRVQALAAGQVDATTVSFGTYQSIAGTAGIHVLVSADDYAERAPGQSKFLAALEPTLEAKRDALQKFTEALADASRAMVENPNTWIEAMDAARDDLSLESIEATAGLNAKRWCVNSCMNPEALAKAVEFNYANPDFKDVKVLPVEDLVDFSFSGKAMETLGVYKGDVLDARN